jgi:hypothetical protein
LAAAAPRDSRAQRELAGSHYQLGAVQRDLGEYPAAEASFLAAAEIIRHMIRNGIDIEASKRALAMMEREAAAAAQTQSALRPWDELLTQPADTLGTLLQLRAVELVTRGQTNQAAQAAAKLRELEHATPEQLYVAASVFGRCATAIGDNNGKELAQEQLAEQQQHMNDAIATLQQAINAGWNDFKRIRSDKSFVPIRYLPQFKALLAPGPREASPRP